MVRPDADALVDAVLRAARTGELRVGARLPTIATLADELHLSMSTVSRAWASLVQMGVIETRRRGGSRVARPVEATAYRAPEGEMARFRYRLAAGYPDPDLQVDLRDVLRRVADGPAFRGYPGKDEIPAALHDALLARVGYQPESIMLDTEVIGALPRILQAVSHRGAPVGVSDPEFPLFTVILRQLGMTATPIPFADGAYDLDVMESVLAAGTRVLMLQTRVHNPTGLMVSAENVADIAGLLRRFGATAIEIDHHGHLVPERPVRLASLAPERVILLSSFAKEIHPDVRVSAITGPRSVLDRVSVWRAGGEWVSAINRAVLEACLTDDVVSSTLVPAARAEYAARRETFRAAFEAVGLTIESNAGLSLWVPVASEQEAMVQLAADSISVARGSAFGLGTKAAPHVHLSLGLVGSESGFLSERLRRAALLVPRDSAFY